MKKLVTIYIFACAVLCLAYSAWFGLLLVTFPAKTQSGYTIDMHFLVETAALPASAARQWGLVNYSLGAALWVAVSELILFIVCGIALLKKTVLGQWLTLVICVLNAAYIGWSLLTASAAGFPVPDKERNAFLGIYSSALLLFLAFAYVIAAGFRAREKP